MKEKGEGSRGEIKCLLKHDLLWGRGGRLLQEFAKLCLRNSLTVLRIVSSAQV